MRIEILQPDLDDEYDEFLLSHDHSLFYHCSRYKNFLKYLLGCDEEYMLSMEGSRIRGVLPLMYIQADRGCVYNSLPYYGSNGGFITDEPKAYRELAAGYHEISSSGRTVSATIIGNPFNEDDAINIRYNYTDYRIAQFTNISSEDSHWDEIQKRIDSSARRNIRKAIREGVTVEIDHTQLEPLRQMHQDNIRAIGGTPKTDKFFASVAGYFRPEHDFNLYVAKKDGVVIAALLLFYFNQTVEYFTPAIASEFRAIQPLALIIITAMTNASKRGFKCWNWGGTWVSQTGVYRFKKKWAAMEKRYYYYTQLNDSSILDESPDQLLRTFPNFFVVPFSALKSGGKHE